MTARHVMDSRSRRSKKYLETHRRLKEEMLLKRIGKEPTKRERKKVASTEFRAQGGL